MKGNILLKTTIIFFLLVNTSYYWEGKLGVFAMLSSILLAGAFIFLTIALLTQIAFAIREKFTNKKRLLLITVTLIILPLTYLYPNGIINFDRLEGENLLIAEREGGGNCFVSLKLKGTQKFIKKSFCFGTTETQGTYEIRGDTIFFKNKNGKVIDDFYQFGIVETEDTVYYSPNGVIRLFESQKDSANYFLWITKNEITTTK